MITTLLRMRKAHVICAGERWHYHVIYCIQDSTIKESLNSGKGDVY